MVEGVGWIEHDGCQEGWRPIRSYHDFSISNLCIAAPEALTREQTCRKRDQVLDQP